VLQEFQLSITALGDDRYLVRTEDTDDGVPVAEAQVQWPVAEWLKRSQPAMDDPLLGLLQGRSASPTASGSDLVALGQDLYEHLFQGESIRKSWHYARGIARHKREFLRLRLGFKDSRLQRLPWEVLRSEGRPLTTRVDLTFARYYADPLAPTEQNQALMLSQGDQPVRVLMVVASPDDQTRLNLRQEVKDIQQVLAASDGPTRIDITVLEQPDRRALTEAVEQGKYQILHYAGHSDLGESGGALHLVDRHTGLTDKLSGEDLGDLLFNNVYLAVFNSCRGAQVAGDDAEMDWRQQNLTQALMHRGVPSVIAMAEQIPDQVAMAFTRLLYKNITQGAPIDLSLGRTRQALVSAFSSDRHYWALPVLYMQPTFDGFLTERDRAAAGKLNPWDSGDSGATSPHQGDRAPALAPPQKAPPSTEADDPTDATVARLVEQLSQPGSRELAEPPLAANLQEESLIPDDSLRQGLGIYDSLPEDPHHPLPQVSGSTPPAIADLPAQERGIPAYRPGGLASPAPQPRDGSGKTSLWAWVGLGMLGVASTLVLTLWITGDNPLRSDTDPAPTPTSNSATDNISATGLIQNAREQIAAEDYAAAEETLEIALNLEVNGQVAADEVTREINALLLSGTVPTDALQLLRGRLEWQGIRDLGTELTDTGTNAERLEAEQLAEAALPHWQDLADEGAIAGAVAAGYAHYFLADYTAAEGAWTAAVETFENQRPNPTLGTPPYVLYAYAGLVMVAPKLALNQNNPDFDDFSPEEQLALGTADAETLATADAYFQRLLDLDTAGILDPDRPGWISLDMADQQTWGNWLWTIALAEEWARVYGERQGDRN
jgi:hypothetical protein